MYDSLEKVRNFLNSGDPEIRTWFLVRHNYLPFILCGSYALLVTIIGPAIMEYRKPYDLRKPMIFFNSFLVASYITVLGIIAWYLPTFSWDEFCHRTYLSKDDASYILLRAGWYFYILKYVEFFDTVFFVLRKKHNQITFLHVVHHTTVPLICWFLGRTENSAMQLIPGIINSFVHVIMYSYYGLAAIGPKVRKYLWWKHYLTQLQMIQFVVVLFHVSVITPLSGCKSPISTGFVMFLFILVILYMFYNYYKANFQAESESLPTDKNSNLKLLKDKLQKKE